MDEDIDNELKMLERQIGEGYTCTSFRKNGVDSLVSVGGASETVDLLSDALSNLNLAGGAATKAVRKCLPLSSTEV